MTSTFIHIAIISLTFYTSTLSAADDAASLLAFKSKADSGNILTYSGNTTNRISAVCKWQGVQCNSNRRVIRLVLENLNLTGYFAANTLTQLDQLRVLSLRNNSLTGTIPDLAGLVNLKALYLNHNYFTGVFPASVMSLHRLRILDLSYNELSGVIPAELSNLDRLSYLRLGSNGFNSSIPPLNQSDIVYPAVCGWYVHPECVSTEPPSSMELETDFTDSNSVKHKPIGLIIGLSVGGFLAVCSSILCLILSIKRLKKKNRNQIATASEVAELAAAADAVAEVMRIQAANELEKKVNKLHQEIATKKSGILNFCSGKPPAYTVEQLMRAAAELLGTGTMGSTYKTVLENRVVVCVKRLDALKLAGTGNEVFERQMEVVGRLRHPNVVAIGAYFRTKEEKLVVYDYQPNGSLFSLIHGSKSETAKPLHWTSCLKIAEDIARGLSYLHDTHNLIHGNLKPSNILLGSDFEARISDHCLTGLLHRLPGGSHHHSTAYKAPETETHHQPTAKSDVYSFGVVLFEMLSGKCAADQPEMMADDMVKWVKLSRGNGGEVEEKWVEMMAEVAVACRVRSPEMRPTMWEVIKMLQEIKEVAIMEDCGLDP